MNASRVVEPTTDGSQIADTCRGEREKLKALSRYYEDLGLAGAVPFGRSIGAFNALTQFSTNVREV